MSDVSVVSPSCVTYSTARFRTVMAMGVPLRSQAGDPDPCAL